MQETDQLVPQMSSSVGYPLAYRAKSRKPVKQGVSNGVLVRLGSGDKDVEGSLIARHNVISLASMQRMTERTRYHRAAFGGEAMDARRSERIDVYREGDLVEMGKHCGFRRPPASVSTHSRISGDQDAHLQVFLISGDRDRTAVACPQSVHRPKRSAWL